MGASGSLAFVPTYCGCTSSLPSACFGESIDPHAVSKWDSCREVFKVG